MRKFTCFPVEQLLAIIPGYEYKQIIHIFDGDTMGNSTYEYYFVKPNVNKLFTDMDFNSDKVILILNDDSRLDISFIGHRHSMGEFKLNEWISPALKIIDGYVEETNELYAWLITICGIAEENLNSLVVHMVAHENIQYDHCLEEHVNDVTLCKPLILSDVEIQKIIDCIDDDDLKKKVSSILLAKRWRRVQTEIKSIY
jgi:hypothetical protein